MPKNGTAIILPKGATDDDILAAAEESVKEKTSKAAARGRDWFGTVTIKVEEQRFPFIAKVTTAGLVLYKAAKLLPIQTVVQRKKGKVTEL